MEHNIVQGVSVKVHSKSCLVAAGAAIVFLVAASDHPALAEGSRDAGLRLAQFWCSGCHALEDAPSATDVAPSFPSIARASGQDRRWLTTWLMAPHPRMPDFTLSREEIEDVIAYLSSLAAGDQ
jgi:mono/diheme cytochrome c family protein